MDNGDQPPTGRPAPDDPAFYEQWAKDLARDYAKNANAVLAQLLTLSTTLFGGAIAFWERMPLRDLYRYALIAGLLCTVIVCLLAYLPFTSQVSAKNAGAVRDLMERTNARKRTRLRIAVCSMTISLGIAAAGIAASAIFAD